MRLYEQMIEFYEKHSNQWNCYDEAMAPPFNAKTAKKFIREYFKHGAKEMVISELVDEIECMRHLHTVSTFFIGLLIRQKMCPALEICSGSDFKFSYLWFLVCLYHDMGYVQEKDWTYKYIYIDGSNKFFKEMNCKKGWNQRREYEDLGLVFVAQTLYQNTRVSAARVNRVGYSRYIHFNNGIILKRSMYRRNTVLNYLEYCKMDENIRHYDHGIVGGLWLYDSLIKNYHRQYMIECNKNSDVDFDDFWVDGRWHFLTEQNNIFAYLADCIIAHNMWPATEATNEKYKKCKLDELTIEKFKAIRFKDNPILYILALADTIEPIKTYSDLQLSEVEIWNGIDIEIEKNFLVITLLEPRLPFAKIANKVLGLVGWIDVRVVIDSKERKIRIDYSVK